MNDLSASLALSQFINVIEPSLDCDFERRLYRPGGSRVPDGAESDRIPEATERPGALLTDGLVDWSRLTLRAMLKGSGETAPPI